MSTTVFNITDSALAVKIAAVIDAHERGDDVAIHAAAKPAQKPAEKPPEERAGRPFVGMTNGRRVEIPDGTELRHTYLDTPLVAHVRDGKIEWNGKLFDSPSSAALAAGLTVNPKCNTPNGYYWWKVEVDGKWITIQHLGK